MHQDTARKATHGVVQLMAGMRAQGPGTESVHSVEQSSAQVMPQQHKHVSTMPQAYDAKMTICTASMLMSRVFTWLMPLSLCL